jgi:ferredoxin
MWKWTLIEQNCTGCGICRDVCEHFAIKMLRDMPYPKPISGKCTGCLDCLNQCPFDAISITDIKDISVAADKSDV